MAKRFITLAASIGLAAIAAASAGCSDSEGDVGSVEGASKKFDTFDKTTIPLDELSGLAVRRHGSQSDILAISDADASIAVGRVVRGPEAIDGIEWELKDTRAALAAAGASPSGAGGAPQWEAINVDGEGRIVVLEENPGHVVVFNADATRVEHVITLQVNEETAGWVNEGPEEGRIDLVGGWGVSSSAERQRLRGKELEAQEGKENSRGEGMVLLRNGHVLVVKEKDPAVLVEFAPEGDEGGSAGIRPLGASERFAHPAGRTSSYVPVRVQGIHAPEGVPFPDISELAVGPRGTIYVLTEKDGSRIGKLGSLESGIVEIVDHWELPTATAVEGLAFLGNRALIGLDVKLGKKSDPNLWAVNGSLDVLE